MRRSSSPGNSHAPTPTSTPPASCTARSIPATPSSIGTPASSCSTFRSPPRPPICPPPAGSPRASTRSSSRAGRLAPARRGSLDHRQLRAVLGRRADLPPDHRPDVRPAAARPHEPCHGHPRQPPASVLGSRDHELARARGGSRSRPAKDPGAATHQSTSSIALSPRWATPPTPPHRQLPGPSEASSPPFARVARRVPTGRRPRATIDGLPAPTCSINFGAAGVAYALTRLGKTTGDLTAFEHAERWLRHAEDNAVQADAFDDGDELTPETVGRISPFHSRAVSPPSGRSRARRPAITRASRPRWRSSACHTEGRARISI